MKKKDRIYAILAKPDGRGRLRCWLAFAFNTAIQDYVERFLSSIHLHNGDYFMVMESQLEVGKEYPYLHYLTSSRHGRFSLWHGRFWLMTTEVRVQPVYRKRKLVKVRFEIE